MSEATCDHCKKTVHKSDAGWWVGDDETADCRKNLTGHEVDGRPS